MSESLTFRVGRLLAHYGEERSIAREKEAPVIRTQEEA